MPSVPQTARVQALCGRGEPLPGRPRAQPIRGGSVQAGA